jgi:hypothetical protein
MLSTTQKKLIKDLTAEFEKINSTNQPKIEVKSLFDEAFVANSSYLKKMENWYNEIASKNAEIKAKGFELKSRFADKLREIFANYNIEIKEKDNFVKIHIVVGDVIKETTVYFYLSTYIAKQQEFFEMIKFDKGKNALDKGIVVYSYSAISYGSHQVDVDNFENTEVFQLVTNDLLNRYSDIIIRK